MVKISCIAIDDEPHALQLLADYAARVPFLEWNGGFQNPFDALPLLNAQKVQLLFLDLNMPNIDGISFYKSLIHKPTVIFTTAYAEFAAESYELSALDYLLKPIVFNRFLQACNKFNMQQEPQPTINPIAVESTDTLYIKSGSKWLRLHWSEILFLEKNENYLVYHTIDKKKILSRQTMSDAEQIVPADFCRIHKSFLVNIKQIESIEREEISIGGQKLPLTDMYRDAFMKKCGI